MATFATATNSGKPQVIPPASEWVRQIVPANPIAAAADGAMLPLVIFAIVFGFGTTRIAGEARARICGLFEAIVEVMLTIVHWVLLAAPVGVFALALLVTARAGTSAVGGLAHYVVIVSLLCIATIAAVYCIIAWFSSVPVRSFAKAAWPAQAIALSTQSSLASLPAMVEGSREQLRVPTHVSDLVLPLGVSLFRITSPAANLGVALYLAHMNGIEGLPLFGGLMLVAVVSGHAEITDPLAFVFLGARLVQSVVHLMSTSNRAVQLRFVAFLAQVLIGLWWAVRLLLALA